MSESKSRVRTRLVPCPLAKTTILGYIQSRSNVNAPWNLPGTPVSYNGIGSLGYPGLTAERTWDETHGRPPYKTGGPFQSIKINSCQASVNDSTLVSLAPVLAKGTYVRGDNLQRYVGGFRPPFEQSFGIGFDIVPYTNFLTQNSSLFPDLSGYGDQAYAKLRPQLEQVGGGVALAELRDLPGMLRTTSRGFHEIWKAYASSTKVKPLLRRSSKIMQPKKAADHFLNHQFGWVPFLKDLRGFHNTFANLEILIAKISNENNRFIRKRATISQSVQDVSVAAPTSGNLLFPNTSLNGTDYNIGGPFWYMFDRVTTTVTASGKFRYYRPEFDLTREDYSSAMNEIRRQMTLYGVRISPSNIYKATPWTWAIDWITNAGKLIDRANDYLVDSVASQYLFVSCHMKKERILVQVLPFKSGHTILSFSRHFDTKQRQAADSPYGFNLSLSNLTARQIAIAGALGISRYP